LDYRRRKIRDEAVARLVRCKIIMPVRSTTLKKAPPPVTYTSPGTPTTAKRLPQILSRRDPPPPEPHHPYAEDGFMFS
jgi:hypothetical protein